jgi:nicotinate-nucleotide pyrophosphorylase (carboxylating)
MLDNMAKADPSAEGGVDVTMLQEAVNKIGSCVDTEASGNVTLHTVRQIASTGVKFISCGSLTHSVKALDISMNIVTL